MNEILASHEDQSDDNARSILAMETLAQWSGKITYLLAGCHRAQDFETLVAVDRVFKVFRD